LLFLYSVQFPRWPPWQYLCATVFLCDDMLINGTWNTVYKLKPKILNLI